MDEGSSLDEIRPISSQLGCKPRRWAELGVGEGPLEQEGRDVLREMLLSGIWWGRNLSFFPQLWGWGLGLLQPP